MIYACLHGSSADLPAIASAFSPSFEQTAPDTIVFRVDGLRRLHGSPREIAEAIAQRAGESVNIAIAETADAAIIAARNFPGVTVAANLNNLDVATLPVTEEMSQVLESWGIYSIEQLAQLPETGLAERFGMEGVYLQRLARGAIDRPLKIFQPETTYEDRIELDHPVSLLEPLLFLIARLLNDQCARLLSNAMVANEVTIRLELEAGTKHDRTEHIRTLRRPHAREQVAVEAAANGSRSAPAAGANSCSRALAQTGASAHGPDRHLSSGHSRARQTRVDARPHPRHRRRKQRRHPRASEHTPPPSFPSRASPATSHQPPAISYQPPATCNQPPDIPFLPAAPSRYG
jgi:hypothetical protein